ncbi:MAG: IS3 family transposase [Nitrospirota bacterium]
MKPNFTEVAFKYALDGIYTTEEKREFITNHRYYYQRTEDLQRQKEDVDLRDRIEEIVVEHPRYGYRRVTAQLKREGIIVNHKRVLRIMQTVTFSTVILSTE